MSRLGLTLGILLIAGCTVIDAPPGQPRVTWPVPTIPPRVTDAIDYQVGWFRSPHGMALDLSGPTHYPLCLIDQDREAVSNYIKRLEQSEATFYGELMKAKQTIEAVNATRAP